MSPLDISSSPNQRWLAKEFASSLDQSHRSIRHDVHGYVELAKHLGETGGPEPDPDFRAALRHRLLHELIEDELVPRQDELALRRDDRTKRKGGSHCFERAPREPWIAAASTVLVVCGGAVGLGQDSSQALPGDVMYPVKRFIEAGEMAMADSPEGEARELMEQAAERLDEARSLVKVDEIHAQQALPATIVDFNEATAEAGNIIVQQSQADGLDPSLISEFRAFSSTSRTVLDEIATSADSETAALIDDARLTLDGFEELLPILDPVLAGDGLPVASEAFNIAGDGGHQGDGSSETSVDLPSSDAVGVSDDDSDIVAPAVDVAGALAPVGGALDSTTTTLAHTVQVVELSTSGTVSMAVATVNHTVKSVDRTVTRTVEAVNKTLETAKETVDKTVAAVDDTVNETVQAVDTTVDQAAETLQQTTETLQQTTDALQQTTDALQQSTDTVQSEPDDAMSDMAGDTLTTLQGATSGGLLSGQTT